MYKIIASTFWVGKNLIYLPTCPSTNDYASRLIFEDKAIEGTTVITSEQTAGRGQRGNSWESHVDKNLTFSVILKPTFLSLEKQFDLSIAISNSIYEALAFKLPRGLSIKWPNDIYFQDKKIAGILIENQLYNKTISWSVVGIGLNVNQKDFLDNKASSIFNITGKEFNLPELLETILISVESNFMKLKSNGIDKLKQNYLSNLYRYQEKHQFIDLRGAGSEVFEGQILGIDSSGRLALERFGQIDYFKMKELAFV